MSERRPGSATTAGGPDVVRLLLVASVSLITLVAFENLAVTTVMPSVAADLDGLRLYAVASGAPLAAQLVATAVGGAWSDARGPRGPLIGGVLLFCAGLVVAGLAPGMAVLAAGRAVQGFGGGLLIVPLYVLVGSMVPAPRQPRFFAAFAVAWVFPGLVGPGIAGFVAQEWTWRWVFLAVPVLTLGASVVLLPLLRHLPGPPDRPDEGRPRARRLVLAATGAGLAAAALQVAGADGGAAGLVLAVAGVAVLVLTLPVLLPAGTVRLRAGVPSAVATRGLLNATFLSAETFLPLLLVREHGWSVAQAGLVLTVASVTWATGSWIQGRVSDEELRRRLLWLGPLTLALGTLVTAGATVEGAPGWLVVVGWTIAGGGMGLVFPAVSVLVLQRTPAYRHGRISSSLQVADALGAALGLAASGGLFIALVGRGGTLAYLAGLLLAVVVALLATLAGARAGQRGEDETGDPPGGSAARVADGADVPADGAPLQGG
ncbi:MFS transporter [Georgenia muralis]